MLVANALANCEPPTPPDVACQLAQEGEREREIDRARERRGGGRLRCRSELEPWMLLLLRLKPSQPRMLRGREKANWRKKMKEAGKGEGGGEI